LPDLTQVNFTPFRILTWFNLRQTDPALGDAEKAKSGSNVSEIVKIKPVANLRTH
jgi:hypothetical protein